MRKITCRKGGYFFCKKLASIEANVTIKFARGLGYQLMVSLITVEKWMTVNKKGSLHV